MKNVKKAAAVKYDYGSAAPKVTAAGMGHIADKILEKAEENKVPIVENEELANLLTNVDVGDEIPLELYDVVAKVIAYVMDIDKRIKSR
ncbi:MAG: EscU/YscU/HrcU family type III secretion system export apparatus switch protein [Clostridium argentinense]|uniref:EscU/YscU/HrcU family type III secretion system export apparatus switch protein n=1 Tax=Clostridium faecium TaxID=2762223 RepID=A0ABR8YP38_9CLOT|nr:MULTISPECIES: EscU/YscU/HrcU family type III secretion system export apparatus switch protein [Clostridium]MBD8046022.1 EscU/YscU/HrcU family type III secretion system export apparatus switch protein [Clostridium faecium]MBS5822871.1 EscU/YscU/HrcU family type III secretion system export apparatus switch protein [Clostridium argentinense]MDU1349116.1 EscU/YscU/HrcU family type III secretion system export apparatus switch protein [Clostridium argentinense]